MESLASPFSQTQGLDQDDPILQLAVDFKNDQRPKKVNLGIGIYKTEEGTSWVLPSVVQAEKNILTSHLDKDYLPIDGDADCLDHVTQLLLGDALTEEVKRRTVTVQTVGGTSALRLASDYLRLATPRSIYISDPTWPNHLNLCNQAQLTVKRYPYYAAQTHTVDLDALLNSMKSMPQSSAMLLHVCCHNPTGCDLTSEQWQRVLSALQQNALFPLFDIAYQGFAEGVKEDAAPLRAALRKGMECFIANSFSKNFGLYGERMGTLTAVCKTEEQASTLRKQLKTLIRRSFSNPPLHAERIIKAILSSDSLRKQWESEVATMRARIKAIRVSFVAKLEEKSGRSFSFINHERGLFTYGWLSLEQVRELKRKYAIYLPDNGRLAVSGLNTANIDYVVDALSFTSKAAG